MNDIQNRTNRYEFLVRIIPKNSSNLLPKWSGIIPLSADTEIYVTLCDKSIDFRDFRFSRRGTLGVENAGSKRNEVHSVPSFGREIVILSPSMVSGDGWKQSRRRLTQAKTLRTRAKYLSEMYTSKYGGVAMGASGCLSRFSCGSHVPHVSGTCESCVPTWLGILVYPCVNDERSLVSQGLGMPRAVQLCNVAVFSRDSLTLAAVSGYLAADWVDVSSNSQLRPIAARRLADIERLEPIGSAISGDTSRRRCYQG